MNQYYLNKMGRKFIDDQSIKVAAELQRAMAHDGKNRSKEIPWEALHYVQNMALFECLVWLNGMVALGQDVCEESFNEYFRFSETLEPKFQDIIETLKDFQPTK